MAFSCGYTDQLLIAMMTIFEVLRSSLFLLLLISYWILSSKLLLKPLIYGRRFKVDRLVPTLVTNFSYYAVGIKIALYADISEANLASQTFVQVSVILSLIALRAGN